MNSMLETLLSRTSIRKFSPRALSRPEIETIVRAGMSAPTAGNRQPWAFVAVDDADILSDLARELPYAGFAKNAPAALVVCGDLEKAFAGEEERLWIQDCSAACQNILLACHAMGLGATWTAIYPLADRGGPCEKGIGVAGSHGPLKSHSHGRTRPEGPSQGQMAGGPPPLATMVGRIGLKQTP